MLTLSQEHFIVCLECNSMEKLYGIVNVGFDHYAEHVLLRFLCSLHSQLPELATFTILRNGPRIRYMLGAYGFCYVLYIILGILIVARWHCVTGLFEQVQWSTCSQGESAEAGSGDLDHKVTYEFHICVFKVVL